METNLHTRCDSSVSCVNTNWWNVEELALTCYDWYAWVLCFEISSVLMFNLFWLFQSNRRTNKSKSSKTTDCSKRDKINNNFFRAFNFLMKQNLNVFSYFSANFYICTITFHLIRLKNYHFYKRFIEVQNSSHVNFIRVSGILVAGSTENLVFFK
jgi:hypothetical protein